MYILFLAWPGHGGTTASAYLTRKGALRRAAQLKGEPGLLWRVKDFSAQGGWCDGNTTEQIDCTRTVMYAGEFHE